ncbi:MAG: class I SAM-dependent methyltransferase [Candidatus Omnitrophica bacterium]|nr:class I SAM-dependent methyltransferase [Candidatus Omnitrophota bacterium]MDD5429499.1 class I SAM-dependent methyltransferase [Candidatus Omnitrophota bacterium]
MVKNSKAWGKLSKNFDSGVKRRINPSAADNILVAWPQILKAIGRHSPGKRVLDYGCGTGGLCNLLNLKGFKVTGIDFSEDMIKIAKKQTSKKIDYFVGDKKTLKNFKRGFAAISVCMVLPFIKNLNPYLKVFFNSLGSKSIIAIAVFNPDFIKALSKEKKIFKPIKDEPRVFNFTLSENPPIKTYLRAEAEYKKNFSNQGFKFLYSAYPKFSKKFIKTYSWPFAPKIPEFLIMAFRKV